MMNFNKNNHLATIWTNNNSKLLLMFLILLFSAYVLFIASQLREDIVPDEPFHFAVSREFTTTWGFPDSVPTAERQGSYLRQNPFLSYWIFGRALNFYTLLQPDADFSSQLVFLRALNGFLSVGTLIFTYLTTKQLITNKWWQLLPVFVLSHTLMFVLLSAGVNYDNLANLFSAAGLYYLIRVLKKEAFLRNSLAWLIFTTLGTFTKEAILPLALIMTVVWIVFIIKNRETIDLSPIKSYKTLVLLTSLLIIIGFNFSIYGINFIRHQSLTPSCRDYYPPEFCSSTGFSQRRAELALSEKPNIFQAFLQGYPEPLRYAFDTWVRSMLMKIFGVMGGAQSYYPIIITYYHILFFWMLVLFVRYFNKTSFLFYSLVAIIGFYALVLFTRNYDIELAYGFIEVALQGRYIFPVITIIYALFSYGLMKVPNKYVRHATLAIVIALFIYGGPIRFIWYFDTVFANWFM